MYHVVTPERGIGESVGIGFAALYYYIQEVLF